MYSIIEQYEPNILNVFAFIRLYYFITFQSFVFYFEARDAQNHLAFRLVTCIEVMHSVIVYHHIRLSNKVNKLFLLAK